MILPPPLAELIQMARTSIRQVNPWIDSRYLLSNAETFLVTIRQRVEMTSEISEGIEDVLRAITPIRSMHGGFTLDTSHLEDVRGEFELRLDALSTVLLNAKPSQLSRAIGLDWY